MTYYTKIEEQAANAFAVALAECYPLSEEDQENEQVFFYAINDPTLRTEEGDCEIGLGMMTHNETLQNTMEAVCKIVEVCCKRENKNPYECISLMLNAVKEANNEGK